MSDQIVPFFATALPEQLLSLIAVLNGPAPLASQLEAITDCAAVLTGSDHADLTLFDPLLRKAIPARSNRIFMHQGDDDAAAWIRRQRSQLLVPDINYATGENDLTLYNRDISSYAGVPVMKDGQVDAALIVFCRSPRPFEKGEPELLSALADLAALAISQHRLERDLEDSSRTLLRLSLTDPATGLATRSQFDQLLEREWQRATAEGLPIAVLMVRVDEGDDGDDKSCHESSLARIARILQASLYRTGDVTARVAEYRLAVLLPETDEAGALAIARRLRRDMTQLFDPADSCSDAVSLQIGISSFNSLKMRPGPRQSSDALYRQAAAALELAIAQGDGDQVFTLNLV